MAFIRIPGGFWYPERPFNIMGHSAATLQPGDALGNLFTLHVRIAGMAILLRLQSDIEYQLLDMSNTVLRSRAWPATRDGVITGAADTLHALSLEWPDADADLAPGTRIPPRGAQHRRGADDGVLDAVLGVARPGSA